jgi:heat shock protein HtpX
MSIVRHGLYFVAASALLALTIWGAASAVAMTGFLGVVGVTPGSVVRAAVILAWVGAAAALVMAKDLAEWGLRWRPYAATDREARAGDLAAAVTRLAPALGLRSAPALMVFESRQLNACAIAALPSKSTLALSSALLAEMDPDAAQAVLAQAMAKIRCADIPALIALGGLLAPFSFFPARFLAGMMGTSLRTGDLETPSDAMEEVVVGILETVLTPLASLLVRHFARGAERRADRIAAPVAGRAALEGALAAVDRSPAAHRDRFTKPLLYAARVRPNLAWLSWHSPAKTRVRP